MNGNGKSRRLSKGQEAKIKEFRSGSARDALQEVSEVHPNNTHIRIGGKTVDFDDPNLRHGFAQIPNIVLSDGTLGVYAKVCYALLLSYAWQSKSCFPAQYLISKEMGCGERTTVRTLKELQKRKLIRIERHGQGRSNTYHIRKLTDGYLPKQFADRG